MLLTGFDAPLEQVMYLDRVITDHNLLQAIARVNRVHEGHKDKGFVVDYVGVGHHLKRALDAYADRELSEILETIGGVKEELNNLAQAHREILELLHKYNLKNFNDPDAFFDLFYDEDIRFEYIIAFQKLTSAMNSVMPRREALEYWQDYQSLLAINELASRHLKDSRLSMKGIPGKLRGIADEFLVSKGITQRIEPISILSPDFEKDVKLRKRNKTKAAEVEHAIRHYIDINIDDDPELFASFAEALEQILKDFAENWDRIYEELEKLRQKIKEKEQENTYGLDRKKQMPIFRILRAELFDNDELNEDQITQNVDLTQHIFNLIEREIRFTGFWQSIPAQNRLKAELQEILLSKQFSSFPNMLQIYKEIISRLIEWARANHGVITRD
jgi:type I restriction enzyme, R subunit